MTDTSKEAAGKAERYLLMRIALDERMGNRLGAMSLREVLETLRQLATNPTTPASHEGQ